MTVAELIEQLEALDPNCEIRLALQQPRWPMRHPIAGVADLRAAIDEALYQAYAAGREDEAAECDPFVRAAELQEARRAGHTNVVAFPRRHH